MRRLPSCKASDAGLFLFFPQRDGLNVVKAAGGGRRCWLFTTSCVSPADTTPGQEGTPVDRLDQVSEDKGDRLELASY